MSRLSFKAFCIEFYAKHAGITGAEVYRLFSESGILKMLDDDYEDLHGLGWEALMPMFDECLGRSKGGRMNGDHTLIRATLVPMIARILSERLEVDEDTALARFYASPAAKAFADDETGLYGQSALNIASMCLPEVQE